MAILRTLVDDVDASLPFYAALGFVVAERWGPPFAILRRGDLDLWLSGPGTSARRALPDGREPAPGGWNRLVVEVDDLDATVATLAAVKARPRGASVSGPGGRQQLIDDPSGNPVELFEAREA
jgi:catechol 2,3-dioxygenase-like lactoylglutathione lyase family enzyme